MIIETVIAGSLWLGAEYLKNGTNSDKQKLDRIFRKCGLSVKYNGVEDTPKLLRSVNKDGYTDYVYRIPEGLSYKDFEKKRDTIQDSLTASRSEIPLFKKKQSNYKEVYFMYDKALTVRIYNEPLPELVPYEQFPELKGWEVPIGITRTEYIKHDFDKIMHMVVAGTTRYGKSIFLKNAITTLIKNRYDDAIFTLIDLKGGLTFNRYASLPTVSIASEPEEALEVLKVINEQMNGVMDHLKTNGFENVQEAGIMKRHFVIVDEGAELAPGIEKDKELRAIKNACEVILSRIARIGGALGYRLIYATQTPYSEVLNHNIKQNCDAKLCFKLQTDKASEVVLGEGITDAHHLPFIKGRGVYLTDRKHIVQTPMIENDYIERVIQNV